MRKLLSTDLVNTKYIYLYIFYKYIYMFFVLLLLLFLVLFPVKLGWPKTRNCYFFFFYLPLLFPYYYYYFFFISACEDKNSNCARWANGGYCTGRYENFMKTNCAKSCQQCGNSCKILCTLYVILSHKWIFGRKRKQLYHNRASIGNLVTSTPLF